MEVNEPGSTALRSSLRRFVIDWILESLRSLSTLLCLARLPVRLGAGRWLVGRGSAL